MRSRWERCGGGSDSGIVIFPAVVILVVLEDFGVPEGVELLVLRWYHGGSGRSGMVTADVVSTVDGRAQGVVQGAFGVAEDVVEGDVELGDLGHAKCGIVAGRKLGDGDSVKGYGTGGPTVDAVLVFGGVRGEGEVAHTVKYGGSPQVRNFGGFDGA